MLSRTTKSFRDRYRSLPLDIQLATQQAYQLWLDDPWHSSLQFKVISAETGLCSVRIGLHYRALGYREENTVAWFWIGPHSKYDRLISQL